MRRVLCVEIVTLLGCFVRSVSIYWRILAWVLCLTCALFLPCRLLQCCVEPYLCRAVSCLSMHSYKGLIPRCICSSVLPRL